ncbi:MAG: hypothetical protein KA250_19330 [Verrucomicrobiales bacterium]|nr:hypothetical protein [Verrucomicrobiales bacterium]MBP9224596.1 hypothetical protein [Verrucomicrobiales bacterium]HQZ26865.1 hypothetical protein [Verrucomicrobiales bacterium]
MNTPALLNVIRMFFLLLAGFIGASVAMGEATNIWWFGSLVGIGFASLVIVLDILLRHLSIRAFSHGTFGLLIGLLCAWLVTRIGFFQAGWVEQFQLAGNIFNLAIFLGFGFIGVMLALRSKREEFSMLIPYVRFRQDSLQDLPTLLDTNVVIDGRIPGICDAGFLGGTLVIPRFVLDDLQKMAESSDDIKRSRGKRGLDSLNQMKSSDRMDISIHEETFESGLSTDAKMVQLADLMDARILTNDTNLGNVARVKGINVLNLNELSVALRPIVSPGDELFLELVKVGRDDHQAVGYLPDGTMIVVNQGKPFIGATRHVVVAGAVQTSAGRLIFAELKK